MMRFRPSRFSLPGAFPPVLSDFCHRILMLFLLFSVSLCLRGEVLATQQPSQPSKSDAIIQSFIDAIQKHYLRSRANPLWNIARDKLRAGNYKDPAQTYQAIQQELPYLEDPELNLLSPDEIKAVQQEALGEKLGLGLCDFCLGMQIETGRARVVTALQGSPAMQAGIEPRDVIVSINGKQTDDMSHEQVMAALRALNPDGVKLHIDRGGERTLSVTLQPSSEKIDALQFEVKQAAGKKKVGYMRVALFVPDLAQKARDAVTQLEQAGVDGYVLDLRNDPGGFLNSAIAVAGLFATGTLGFEVRSNQEKQPVELKGPPMTAKPMAVLINAGTASASEFLSGGLQGLHRAVLVGEPSNGRGQAQIFIPLSDGYGIQIPSVELLTPDGVGFRGKGIAPDLEVKQPQLPESERAGPHDKQFLKAVQSLTTDSH